MDDAIDTGIFWLVWVPAGLALAAAWALLLSPLLIPYLAIRWAVGPERANRVAWMTLVVIAVVICAYEVVLWVADPMSFLAR